MRPLAFLTWRNAGSIFRCLLADDRAGASNDRTKDRLDGAIDAVASAVGLFHGASRLTPVAHVAHAANLYKIPISAHPAPPRFQISFDSILVQ